jgi:peptide/nickel transport system permease protein
VLRYAGRKILILIPTLFAVSFLTFLLINLLPGDPTSTILPPGASAQDRIALRHQFQLDKPLPVQYVHWLGHAVTGDLGRSYITHESVAGDIGQRLPLTVMLLIEAEVLALGIAIPVALIAAERPGSWVDRTTTTTSFGMLSLPNFLLGILLIFLLSVRWHIFPSTGFHTWFTIGNGPVPTPWSIFLPAITLAVGSAAVYSRLLRSDLIATYNQQFITFARSKGLSRRFIALRHAFRPSTFTLLTVMGLEIGALLGGAFLIEYIFALPGLGRLAVVSIFRRDYVTVQGVVLFVSFAFVMVNFVVDLLYAALDPRVRDARVV